MAPMSVSVVFALQSFEPPGFGNFAKGNYSRYRKKWLIENGIVIAISNRNSFKRYVIISDKSGGKKSADVFCIVCKG
jgi:hypothetical protein